MATLQKYAETLDYRVEVKFVKERGLASASTRTLRERGPRLAGLVTRNPLLAGVRDG